MSNGTDIITLDKAPVEVVNKEQLEAAVKRMKVIVPDGGRMSVEQLAVIAQESILYRTMPGRDIHYFLDKSGNLKSSPDYKYLVSWAEARERERTGNPRTKITYSFIPIIDPQKRQVEGVNDNEIAVQCTIKTDTDRDAFRQEVKAWTELGFSINDAFQAAKEALGEVGTSAVGVYRKGDNLPKGWSPKQQAEKLALKNAINKRWGTPTVDEMQAFVRKMARNATDDIDWQNVPLELPAEAQARWAETEALTREVIEHRAERTPEENRQRFEENVELLRGKDEGGIGDDGDYDTQDRERFDARVIDEIPWYQDTAQIADALKVLELDYDVENEEMLFDELALYASQKADQEAEEPEQPRLIDA